MTTKTISSGEGEDYVPVKVSLACGQNKPEGFIGVDVEKVDGVDVVANLEQFPWPFADDSVDEIECSHYVEHTPDLNAFMDECYRILKPGGKMHIVAPYYSSIRAWQDPTHKRAISEMTFFYYNKGWRDSNKLDHYGIKSNFDFQWGYAWDNYWGQRSEESRAFALRHYINVVSDIYVTLEKIALDTSE
jgi:predicted SAM-dependent methyltransferase